MLVPKETEGLKVSVPVTLRVPEFIVNIVPDVPPGIDIEPETKSVPSDPALVS